MATYKLIASTTVGSSVATITLSSIPNTYTDLLLVASLKSNQASSSDGAYALLELNGSGTTDTGGRFNFVSADVGQVGTASTGYSAPNYVLGWGAGSEGGWSSTRFYLYNYTSSSNKAIRCDSWQEATTNTNCRRGFTAGFYNSSSAISSVTIRNAVGSYINDSTVYLYGISNA
jgi:hypothetical protein